jgi:glycosyltransferase involved in cell wall biosynthesis
MNKISCSVGILTFNSASTLRRALESVKDFDDIIVCDGGSSDGTLTIASEFGARIIAQNVQFKNPDGTLKDFAGVRNQLLDAAQHDWFLYIDSDETISDGLREDIREITKDRPLQTSQGRSFVEPLVYKIPYGIMMDGREIRCSSSSPGYQTRFFNKQSGARFEKPVHERIVFDANVKIGTLTHPWYVHSTREEWTHYLREMRPYRALELARTRDLTFGGYLYFVYRNLRTSLATLVRAAWVYLRYGFRDTLPVRGELGRALNPLLLIALVTRQKFFSFK